MLIDTHMHEMTYSKDSFLKLDEMVRIARAKGLDGICITDHDSMGLKEYAAEYSRREKFPIFTGIDFFSLQGEIVAYGLEEYPKERGLEDNLRTVHGLDGLEVLNGSTSLEACYKAAEYAEELGLFTLGSSDCHVPEKVGVCATYFPEKVHTMEEFLEVFKKGTMCPAFYKDGQYHIITNKKSIYLSAHQ